MNKKRTLIYLVDGAHAEVLPELITTGALPNILRIIDEGTRIFCIRSISCLRAGGRATS